MNLLDFTKQIVPIDAESPSDGTIPMRKLKTHGGTLNIGKEFCFVHISVLIADTTT